MSASIAVRKVWAKIVKHGRDVFQKYGGRSKTTQTGQKDVELSEFRVECIRAETVPRPVTRLPTLGRKISSLVSAAVRPVGTTFGSTGGRALGGGRAVNYALVGLGLATGSKLYGPVDPHGYNAACNHIQRLFLDDTSTESSEDVQNMNNRGHINVEDFEFGPLIGKGCNAAVYAARFKHLQDESRSEEDLSVVMETQDSAPVVPVVMVTDEDSTAGEDSFIVLSSEDDVEEFTFSEGESSNSESIDSIEILTAQNLDCDECPCEPLYDLAIKMVYNYDTESNTYAILQNMSNEMVPAQKVYLNDEENIWQNGHHVKKKCLKAHPNIVDMAGVFVGAVPYLPGAEEHYPMALPQRLYDDGSGRNETMFLVMKRYSHTLRDFLHQSSSTSNYVRTILLAQLTEAVVHLSSQGVAHRDIKSDNILVETSGSLPELVLGDFGCCLRQENGSLLVSYQTDYINKGGNGALMAPEIACATAGYGAYLDYNKADIWAVGAVAYEIFGMDNPFYRSASRQTRLDSRTYTGDQLPSLSDDIQEAVRRVVSLMTVRNPKQRPSASLVANMLQVILWAPQEWQKTLPSEQAVMDWIVQLTVQMLYYSLMRNHNMSNVEYTLKKSFLARVQFTDLMKAIHLMLE